MRRGESGASICSKSRAPPCAATRRKNVRYRIGIVQPGISIRDVQAEHTAMLGAASFFGREVTDVPLVVWASA